ncbi:hypothetical protein SAMN02745751_03675 [Dethiosulfatibacter aminovorans DSM 17477]|uniref:Uncharacterized protein n=1 Tax=Dethiosulfatibacter aminovorans DSM 17477 TaxID=1121476 RepID=A0A1M6N3V0_9FIRM|nr:hypothetical protein [Dethiosulfatibacter aminovorans]SHJ90263.1 hypothetical protein SAMN02745751_03675 [Dethiosulfatibacter aminovorans DSM 17477]
MGEYALYKISSPISQTSIQLASLLGHDAIDITSAAKVTGIGNINASESIVADA